MEQRDKVKPIKDNETEIKRLEKKTLQIRRQFR